jgi:hypothetical protein
MTTRQVRHQKKAFLDRFREHGNVSRACRETKVNRADVYRWKEHDEDFMLGWNIAEVEATEVLESAAYDRAVHGVTQETPIYFRGTAIDSVVKTEYSDTLLIFLLKARAPEKYRERHDVKHSGQIEHIAMDNARQVLRVNGGSG